MDTAGNDIEDCRRAVKAGAMKLHSVRKLILLNHYLCGFDNNCDGVTLLELEFVGAAAGDGTLDKIVSDANDYVGHDIAELNFFDLTAQFVSG
jgi:hypothetical protein